MKRCKGCGSTKTIKEIQAKGFISCCPDRYMEEVKMNDDIKKVLENKATEYSRRAETLYPPNKKLAYTAGATEFYEKGKKDDRMLRELLWKYHQFKDCLLYADDGEMQCNTCRIDFKRDDIDVIKHRLFQRQMDKESADETPTK